MVISKDEFLKSHAANPNFKLALNGPFGSGKTYKSMTFPKWAYAMIEPHGIQTARSNPILLENMVCYESFVPSETEDIKVTFERLSTYIKAVRQMVLDGKVQTFILDNGSHLMENRWIYINKYERLYGKAKDGEPAPLDTRSMYGTLGRWAYKFFIFEVLSLPCHVVVTFHQSEEMEEDAKTGKTLKTGQIITDTLGGFRDDIGGLVNGYLFLEQRADAKAPNGYRYFARCMPGAGKQAKNNLGLPEIVEDISYQKLVESLPKLS